MAYDPASLARFQEIFNSKPRIMSVEHQSQRLVWHLCHLSNLTTSGINVYLSLVSLSHDTNKNGTFTGSYFAYPPAMRAQAAMLVDAAHNLELVLHALTGMYMHIQLSKHASYNSLISAAEKIVAIVKVIPQTSSPFFPGGVLEETCMPKKEVTELVRVGCDELTELCDGNSSKGIVGWKQCWRDVSKQLGVP